MSGMQQDDPFYRWLCAEAADLDWQFVETEFEADLARADHSTVPAIDEVRETTAVLLLRLRK